MKKKTVKKYNPKTTLEPIWESEKDCSQFDLVYAFQWYDQNKSASDARGYLVSYLGASLSVHQKTAAKMLNDNWDVTTGWMARCLSRGAKVDEETRERFKTRTNEFIGRLNTIVEENNLAATAPAESNVISIQERVKSKTDQFIMELEAMFDKHYFEKNLEQDFDAYKWFVDNDVKPIHATKLAEYFRERAGELLDIIKLKKKDAYVKESYPRSDKEIMEAAKLYASFVSSAERLASNKLASRKPRKKKPVSMEKKVGKLRYLKEDTEFKLSSINPVKIMAAEKLWVFNVKTRKLGVYVAADGAGLSVKGSKIENYKYSESIAKTLRKPKDVLTRVLDGGKLILRKVMGEINSKPQQLNGTINKDTILLRVE